MSDFNCSIGKHEYEDTLVGDEVVGQVCENCGHDGNPGIEAYDRTDYAMGLSK